MMNNQSIVIKTAFLTFVIEGLTLLARFGLDLQSTRDTASVVGAFTFGIRIHHSYLGFLLAVLVIIFFKESLNQKQKWAQWSVALGLALVFSDLIHHFIVLWAVDGHHHFDLVYPELAYPEAD